MGIIRFSDDDEARIKRRVKRILECRKAASGLEHLKRDDRERLEVLKDGVRLIRIHSEHHADELAAGLHGDMPWMAPATEVVWHAMRRSVREGWPAFRMPPLLLDGPPGIGKSRYARRLGELLATSTTVIEATGENASFGIVGSQRGWGGSYPGRLIETVLQSRIANPVMIVDEIEKAGRATSTNGHAFGLAEALLPLLEPLTAKRWSCPYYQVRFDMSLGDLGADLERLPAAAGTIAQPLPADPASSSDPRRIAGLRASRGCEAQPVREFHRSDLRGSGPSLLATASAQSADRHPHAATCCRSGTGADASLSR
ncbi:MAG: AAA family ATPase [Paracoccus aminovorans]|nr:AAA family ATPase [Paracoccus aminovorans]